MHSRSLVSDKSGFSAYTLLAAMALAVLLLLAGCSKSNDAALAPSADAKLAGEIQARLNSDPLLSASQRSSVGVRVQNGVATLSGWVTNDSELTAALNAAQGVEGVKQVVSRLQVGQEFAAMPAAAPAFDSAPEQAEPRYAVQPRVTRKPTAARPSVRPAVRYETPQYQQASTPAVSTSGPSPAASMTPYPASGMSSEPMRSEPVAQPVREVQRVSIPAGTEVPVRLIDSLSSETTNPDQLWRGTVNGDVYVDDEVVIPSGSEVEGRVVSVNKSKEVSGWLHWTGYVLTHLLAMTLGIAGAIFLFLPANMQRAFGEGYVTAISDVSMGSLRLPPGMTVAEFQARTGLDRLRRTEPPITVPGDLPPARPEKKP